MGKIFLFDVDGTLTPAKSKIDKKFQKQFLKDEKRKDERGLKTIINYQSIEKYIYISF